MKNILAILLSLMILCGTACAESFILEEENFFPLDQKMEIDLDSDGEAEKVQLRMEGVVDEACLRILIEGTDGAMNIYDTWIMYPTACFSMDMDNDGVHEIFLSGDMQSDDYITYCLNYDLESGIIPLTFADVNRGMNTDEFFPEGYGRIVALDGKNITLRGSQDVLGTWMADRTFTLKDGEFVLGDDGLWIMEDITDIEEIWDYFCLIPVKEVPVVFEDGSKGTLAVGEKFVISYTDKASVAGFVTMEGKKGSISISENVEEGWGNMIEGVADYEYFEYIPYAD